MVVVRWLSQLSGVEMERQRGGEWKRQAGPGEMPPSLSEKATGTSPVVQGEVSGMWLALFGSLLSPVCPCLAADTFVCLDFPERINHTNRAPPRESSQESSATPPPPVNTCPILRGTHWPSLKSLLWKTHSWRELSLCDSSAF